MDIGYKLRRSEWSFAGGSRAIISLTSPGYFNLSRRSSQLQASCNHFVYHEIIYQIFHMQDLLNVIEYPANASNLLFIYSVRESGRCFYVRNRCCSSILHPHGCSSKSGIGKSLCCCNYIEP